jgi:UDP-hydrolysing UDP-N-acetyl-D-glucosamine 2-epimerase
VSKLSTAHFVATADHRDRLIEIGESPSRIFLTGSLSLDNFIDHKLMPLSLLCERLGVRLPPDGYAIMLFHPDPSEKESVTKYTRNIIEATLDEGLFVCIGYPNTDPANRSIIDIIESFRAHERVCIYKNISRDDFIALYKHAKFIIGNSSSGIMEAASVPIPAINIGLRQRGRHAGANVIFCDGDYNAIITAIRMVMEPKFRNSLNLIKNPYGDGRSARRALKILLDNDFTSMRLKTEDPLDNHTKSNF